ncbi:MAG: hypothetical protein AB8B56_04050, partial [Crocinitomicaceae bacterium]
GYVYQGVPAGLPTVPTLETATQVKSFTKILDVIGASEKAHVIGEGISRMSLPLVSSANKRKLFTTAVHESAQTEVRTILKLENIRGKGAAPVHNVFLNMPEDESNKESHLVGTVSLFGMESASKASSHSSGSGLSIEVDITEEIGKLRSMPNWKDEQIEVSLEPRRSREEDVDISIGRISLYSE